MQHQLLALLFLLPLSICSGQQRIRMTEAIAHAQQHTVAARLAAHILATNTFQFQVFQAGLRPQLTLETTLPGYSRDYLDVRQPDGSVRFLSRAQHTAYASLSLLQVIPQTGGFLSVHSSLTRFDDFDRHFSSYTGIPISIELEQPLFAFNPYKWSKQIEPLKLEEAQKQYQFQQGEIALQAVRLFFDALQAQEQVQIAATNLDNTLAILHIEQNRIPLGATTREKVLQIELQVLQATQAKQEAEVDHKNAQLNLLAYLGHQSSQSLECLLPEEISISPIDTALALRQAKENRADYTAFQRRTLESKRDVEKARLTRTQVNLFTTLGFNGAGEKLPEIFQSITDQQRLRVGIRFPILDWGRQKAQYGIAIANEQVTAFTLEQEALNLHTEVVNQVNTLQLLQTSIHFAQQTTHIANERFQLALEQYQIGRLSLTELLFAIDEKDHARRSYILSLRRFWEAYYTLRQMTLGDLEDR